MGKKFATFDTQRNITAFYDSIDSPVPHGVVSIEISDGQWRDLINAQSSGKRLVIKDDGEPAALDPLPPTPEQVRESNEFYRKALLEQASVALAPLQTAIMLNEATDAETVLARAWVEYTRMVKAINISEQNPSWPIPPVEKT